MSLDTPQPDLQIFFYKRLEELRSSQLLDALLATVSESNIDQIDQELNAIVDEDALRRVAGWGLRGEVVFAMPSVLEQRPQLLGYYRLLLGFSQKQFYGKAHGIGPFKSMETKNSLSAKQKKGLRDLSQCLCGSAESLVQAVERLSKESVHELTLLTLGTQLRGGALNRIGQEATRQVFDVIKGLVELHIVRSDKDSIEIRNAAGATVRIVFAADPDIAIHAELASGGLRPIVAVEIKGGRDASNVHNRIGEAEKSHQKARRQGFTECWTIVGVADLDSKVARQESPSTDRFFSLDEIVETGSGALREFKEQLLSRLGVRD